MRLLTGSVMTHRDRRVAEAWSGPWTGLVLTGTRVTSPDAGQGCAKALAEHAKELCEFPVLVIYDPPPYVRDVPRSEGSAYEAPQRVVCMWPADSDPHRFLETVCPTMEEPTSEYGFVHHFLEYTTWEKGLFELASAADRQSELYRVNWR